MMHTVWSHELAVPADVPNAFISLRKPAEVMNALGVLPHLPFKAYPAAAHHLARVHDLRYVTGVMGLGISNGFGNCSRWIRDHVLAANGVMIEAVRLALERPQDCVFAPVSGFHHAHYAESVGYCTFNGLLAAVAAARLGRRVPQVLIIDGDAHYGDGTDDILTRTTMGGITNLTHRKSGSAATANTLSPSIWEMQIRGLLANRPWDLVLYQAGADAHKDDPYGEGYLDDDAWDHRDYLVFRACHALKVPLVFNLAGGYNGDKTIALHTRTVKAAQVCYKSSHLRGASPGLARPA